MSGRIADEVYDNAPDDLTQAELTVLVVLALDAREKTRRASYSDVETIVRKSRLKPGTVRNALSTLSQRALIKPVHDRVHRGGYHQEYDVAVLAHHHRAVLRVVRDPESGAQ